MLPPATDFFAHSQRKSPVKFCPERYFQSAVWTFDRLMYTLAKKSPKHNNILIVIVSLFGRSIHSVIVYCFMGVLFPEVGLELQRLFLECSPPEIH